ncbi:zinc-ribbon domain-containing protein [Methylobacterium oryzisoli]|uniref:zinc-ribbon domain-containing protein n=1 Tax=Methylobacterium oryzisoli TaxID=3385502 RepID=UPI0038924921
MLIVCPSCASEYTLDPERIGPEGRTVRCAACRERWFVARPAEPEPAAEPLPDLVPDLAPSGEAVFTAVDAPVPVPPAAARPRFRPRLPARTGLALGLALLAALPAAALVARETVVRAAPQTARLYAGLGLPVNLRGLGLRDVVAFQAPDGPEGGRLVVEGDVVSASPHPRTVPPLALEIRDEHDRVIYRWTAEAPRARLEPEESARFRAELAAPPAKGRRVLVRFAAVDSGPSAVSLNATPAASTEVR